VNAATCTTQTFTGLTAPGLTQPFNGQFLIMNVVSLRKVLLWRRNTEADGAT